MDKKLFAAFFITLIFLIVWSHLFPNRNMQPPPAQEVSEGNVQETKGRLQERPLSQAAPIIEEEAIDLPQAIIGNYVVTYSPQGGYIKNISIEPYGEEALFKNIGFIPEDEDKEFTAEVKGEKLVFTAPQGEKKEFIFQGYCLTIKFTSPPAAMVLFSNDLTPNMLDRRYQEFFYYQNNNLQRKSWGKIGEDSFDNIEFAGSRERYFCISLLKEEYSIRWEKHKDGKNSKNGKKEEKVYLFLTSPPAQLTLYIGPQTEKELKPVGLEGIINYGFFHGIGVVMIKVLYFFHFLTKNWGISLILFSTFIYFLLFPFTAKSTKAMKRMQELQPEVEEIKKKYKDNPQKLNKETMALYKKYKINPLGGCLPLFFQFPVFIALYQVLLRFVELKGASFLWIKDLSLPDRAFTLPSSLPLLGKYINLLPVFIVILGLIQQKITVSSSSSSEQKSMGLFFSVFLGVIFYNFPSCLVLYWFVQNIFTLTYQMRIRSANHPVG
ncbi:MAG: membrane protein insertase YidC [Candidatus Omnitrophica bacterium]|nr:membrane protein insertase YidC [Candidatus Omnitrophota bacterium]